MNDGERLIERLDQSRRAMQRALSSVDAQREICPGWTVREILAHIAGWDEVGTGTVRAHSAGEAPPPLEIRGIDAYNEALISKCEGLSYEEVVQCWRSTRRELVDALADAPPEKLHERAQFPWGETGNISRLVSILAEHEREHADEILEVVSGEAEDETE
jgi:uncharacterized protein (TIGR03083 family)